MNILQIISNSFYGASIYVLCAIGFAMVYRSARFFNFAHGFSIISGPYAAYALKEWGGLSLTIACLCGVLIAGGVGCILEFALFRPMRKRAATSLTLLLASLGAYVMLQNLVSLLFGDYTRVLRNVAKPNILSFYNASMTSIQLMTVIIAILCITGLIVILLKTSVGKAIRAVSDDVELANVCGINSNKVILLILGAGSSLAGLAGILLSLDVDLSPSMGLPYLMITVVIVIIGGRSKMTGILFGACLLSLTQNFGVWFIGAQWRDAIAFAVLLIYLIVRTPMMSFADFRMAIRKT